MSSPLHRVLKGEITKSPPFWLMRQAGRYLPEYRELRAKAGSFLTLCYTPELAAEVTLQPIRRFDMDAAIIFSDILVVPHAMGMHLEFVECEGPKLSALKDGKGVDTLGSDVVKLLTPIADSLALVRAQLPADKALIGFCGAPWTVACYMTEGGKSRDWEGARRFALKEEAAFSRLIDKLVIASRDYLLMQAEAGADVLQIFDSWAGVLSAGAYRKWVIEPTRRLVGLVRERRPDVPIIGFPRASGVLYEDYACETGVDAVGIDFQTPMEWAVKNISQTVQGNLDPLLLAGSKQAAVAETRRLLEITRGKPFIFNLGHGIVPHTPIENVQAVCDAIRTGNA